MTKPVVAFRNFANPPIRRTVFISLRLLVITDLFQFLSSRRWAKGLFISRFLQMLVCQHFGCGIEFRTETERLRMSSFPSRGHNARRPIFHVDRATTFDLITPLASLSDVCERQGNIRVQDVETCGGNRGIAPFFFNLSLNEGKLLGPRPGRFIPGKSAAGARRTGGCVDCGSGNGELVPSEIPGLSNP